MLITNETIHRIQTVAYDAYKSSGQLAALMDMPACPPKTLARTLESTAANLEQGAVAMRTLCESLWPALPALSRRPLEAGGPPVPGGRRSRGRQSAGHRRGHGPAAVEAGMFCSLPAEAEGDHGGGSGGPDVRPALGRAPPGCPHPAPAHYTTGSLRGLWGPVRYRRPLAGGTLELEGWAGPCLDCPNRLPSWRTDGAGS